MAAPRYGWLDALTEHLNKEFEGRWAYTGSFAMYCRAQAEGEVTREPNDVDILTSQLGAVSFSIVAKFGGACDELPGPTAKHCKIRKVQVDFVKVNLDVSPGGELNIAFALVPEINIDVLSQGGVFGDLRNCTSLVVGNNRALVATVNQMVISKQSVISDSDTTATEMADAQRDIGALQSLRGYIPPPPPVQAPQEISELDGFSLDG